MNLVTTIALFLCLLTLQGMTESPAYEEIKTLSLKKEFGTTQDWHVTAYQPKGTDADTGDISAKLCFWILEESKSKNCTEITSASDNNKMVYHYQTVEELSVIPTPRLVKFVASYSGGGSGILRQISFWGYSKGSDSFDYPAGLITLTGQGEYKLFSSGVLKDSLVTADADWEDGEGHFAPHHFYVEVYNYATGTDYRKILSYLTPVKYPSFDDTDEIDVISKEVPRIKNLLGTVKWREKNKNFTKNSNFILTCHIGYGSPQFPLAGDVAQHIGSLCHQYDTLAKCETAKEKLHRYERSVVAGATWIIEADCEPD
jgi:hypothetical protein